MNDVTAANPLVWENYRMNDYVGSGIYATVTWHQPCTEGVHLLGRLTCTCSRCGAVPTIKYEEQGLS